MEVYVANDDGTTAGRKTEQARARRARHRERRLALTILNDMKPLQVQEAITRACRSESTTTCDGTVRRYRVGAHVAAMCRQLLHWEGKGEAQGYWIHKTGFDWEYSEAGLTPSKLRTARRNARKEGLIEEKPGTRRDKRATVKYRLDMWKLAQIVVQSELENSVRLLASEGRDEHKGRLKKKIRSLEVAKADLALRDAPGAADAPNPGVGDAEGGARLETRSQQVEDDTHAANAGRESGECLDTPANLAGHPRQLGTHTVEDPSGFLFARDSSRGGSSVASSSPTPSPLGSSDDGCHKDLEEIRCSDKGGEAPVPATDASVADVPEPEIPPLTGTQRGALVRLVLAELGGESEVSRLAERCAAGEDVTPEEVAQQAIELLPGHPPPLEVVVASVEGLLVGMRGEWP